MVGAGHVAHARGSREEPETPNPVESTMSDKSTLIGLASDFCVGGENASGEFISDVSGVMVVNAGDLGMVEYEEVSEEEALALVTLPAELEKMTDEELGNVELDISPRELAYFRAWNAKLEKENQEKHQAQLCESEMFDRDPSPYTYRGVDRDDVARIVELQTFITSRQEKIDDVQEKMEGFKASPISRDAFMKWVEYRKALITQRLTGIGIVKKFTSNRGEEYRKALWASYFQIEDLDSWMESWKEENVLNTFLTRGEVDEELDNAMLKEANLNRGDDLSVNHLQEKMAEEQFIEAPMKDSELPLWIGKHTHCECSDCRRQRADAEESASFEQYVLDMDAPVDADEAAYIAALMKE